MRRQPWLDVLGVGTATIDDFIHVRRYPTSDEKEKILGENRCFGGLRVVFDLLPQSPYIDGDCVVIGESAAGAEGAVRQLRTREDLSGMSKEGQEQAILYGSQRDRDPTHAHLSAPRVHDEVSGLDDASTVRLPVFSDDRYPAGSQTRFDP